MDKDEFIRTYLYESLTLSSKAGRAIHHLQHLPAKKFKKFLEDIFKKRLDELKEDIDKDLIKKAKRFAPGLKSEDELIKLLITELRSISRSIHSGNKIKSDVLKLINKEKFDKAVKLIKKDDKRFPVINLFFEFYNI